MSSSSKRQRIEEEPPLELTREIGVRGKPGKSNDKLNNPYSICVDAAFVYVADYGNHRVQVFDKRFLGKAVRTFGTGIAGEGDNQFYHPISIAVDDTFDVIRKGYLYVSDFWNRRVQVLDKGSGALIRSVGAGIIGKPQGICLNRSKRELMVADTSNNRIQIFHCYTGELLRSYKNVNTPSSLALNEDHNELYVSDWECERVIVLDSETGMERSAQCLKTSEVLNPYGIVVDRVSRHVFVACSEANTVRRFCPSKSDYCFKPLDSVFESGALNGPREMCFDDQTGCLYIADRGNHFVRVDRSYLAVSSSKEREELPLIGALRGIVNTDECADIILALDDRSRLPAHKLVLYLRSPKFKRILSKKPTKKRDEFGIVLSDLVHDTLYVDSRDGSFEVLVRGFARAPMQEFLSYLYTDKFPDGGRLSEVICFHSLLFPFIQTLHAPTPL